MGRGESMMKTEAEGEEDSEIGLRWEITFDSAR